MSKKYSRLCIAGAGSGVGKTTVALGLLAALKRRALPISPFKCGPDYIDPEFHRAASGSISHNLDLWMMGKERVLETFMRNSQENGVSVVEGVMGLFDGIGSGNEGSTAKVAKALQLPVLLVINARGIAGTVAAIVRGFVGFEDGVNIVGVIANNVGSENHAKLLSAALDEKKLPPLLGYLPRNEGFTIPERHLGLISATETVDGSGNSILYDRLAERVEEHLQVDEILKLCETDYPSSSLENLSSLAVFPFRGAKRIAVALDEAFHFYYEDNLDMIRDAGVDIVQFSPLHDNALPSGIDAVYIGGGFPESFAEKLAANVDMKSSINNFAESDGFIYGECGGLMYLSEGITDNNGGDFNMCGVLPLWTAMDSKMRSLGYREIRINDHTQFGERGVTYRGHEFHWSSVVKKSSCKKTCKPFCEIRNARGGEWQPGGYRYKNVFASYVHLYF